MSGIVPEMLVTLEQGQQHLRLDSDYDFELVTLYIKAASRIVVQHVDQGMLNFKDVLSGAFIAPYADSGGNFLPPIQMQQATLVMLGYLYSQRDEDQRNEFADGRLPRPVRAILSGLRSVPL